MPNRQRPCRWRVEIPIMELIARPSGRAYPRHTSCFRRLPRRNPNLYKYDRTIAFACQVASQPAAREGSAPFRKRTSSPFVVPACEHPLRSPLRTFASFRLASPARPPLRAFHPSPVKLNEPPGGLTNGRGVNNDYPLSTMPSFAMRRVQANLSPVSILLPLMNSAAVMRLLFSG